MVVVQKYWYGMIWNLYSSDKKKLKSPKKKRLTSAGMRI